MRARAKISNLFWLAILGFLGLYLYGLLMGAFSPGELVGFTILAVAGTLALVAHETRARRAARMHSDPAHDEFTRALHQQRETRGF